MLFAPGRRLRFALTLVLICGAASGVAAQAQQAPTTEECEACHNEAAVVRSDGTSVAVPVKAFGQSVHGSLACVDCHRDLAARTEWPHPDKLAKVACASCHEEPVAKYATSVHAKARRERADSRAATCVDCHGMHDIRASTDPTSKTYHLNLPQTCGQCHGNTEVISREKIRIGNVVAQFQDSIHGRALAKSGLTVAPDCSDCHGSHDIQTRDVKESRVHRLNVPATCGKCHQGIERQYRAGIHGAKLHEGSNRAPTCADCHSAHSIRRIDTPGFQLDIVRECGSCHNDKIATYRDTFHGQVTALGFQRVAKCVDCHGAHEVLPASNPASLVSKTRLIGTCGRCHAVANESFVKYDPHPNPRDYNRNPVLWWVNRVYTVLIPGCFSFFALHSLLWFWRSRKDGGDRT